MIRPGMRSNLDNRVSKAQGEKNVAQAKHNTLRGPGGNVAQQALRKQVAPTQVKTAPVGRLELPERQSEIDAPVDLPTGGPVLPEPEQEFDPSVFQEDMVNNMIGQIRTKQFMQSPRVKDATTSVQIKEFFNQHNPNRKADPRSLIEQVTSRMGM